MELNYQIRLTGYSSQALGPQGSHPLDPNPGSSKWDSKGLLLVRWDTTTFPCVNDR